MKVTTDNFTVEIFDETPLRGYFEHEVLGDNCAGELSVATWRWSWSG